MPFIAGSGHILIVELDLTHDMYSSALNSRPHVISRENDFDSILGFLLSTITASVSKSHKVEAYSPTHEKNAA